MYSITEQEIRTDTKTSDLAEQDAQLKEVFFFVNVVNSNSKQTKVWTDGRFLFGVFQFEH